MNKLEMFKLPSRLRNRYYELKQIEPDIESSVQIYDKTTGTYRNSLVARKYLSYGITPEFDRHTKKSYMFNNKISQLPDELKPFLAFAKTLDERYNNVYVNWYDSGANYIDPHSDCTAKFVPNSKILIMNLNEGQFERTFKIQHKAHMDRVQEIKLENGLCLLLDSKEQESYRHWVGQEDTDEGRISVTFRMIKT